MRMPQRARSVPTSLAAPVGGWNARDALGEMEVSDAVYLVNWVPGTSDVFLRNGYTQYATGITGQVETVMSYAGGGTDKLFAAAGGSIYDVTAGGAVGAASITGMTNARWQYRNISTAGGNFLVAVNGSDTPQVFNGTAWANISVTGVTAANLVHVELHKNRLWFCENNTLNAWYLPVNSIGGVAAQFSLDSVARMGGYLMAIGTWTIDAGYGVDDLAVFVTSKGEIIVYKGTDPSSANTWALVGVWQLGSPIGRRCLMKYAGDLLIVCQDGVLPLSGALQSSRVQPQVALSYKIQWAVSNAISSYGANFGWQTLYFPKANLLFVNVPVGIGLQQQYVMNTITKAWCSFTGWAANCFELFHDDPYFGGNGFVAKAWNGSSDAGTNIASDGKQAFSYFGSPGQLKRFTMMRPVINTDGAPTIYSNVNVDFDDTAPTSALFFAGIPSAVWDTSTWDSAKWSAGLSIQAQWQGVTGIGRSASIRLKTASQGIQVRWISTDLVMEHGAIL